MVAAMIYKPGDLPDCKYASESLMPRVIGCTQVYLRLRWFYLCVESCRCDNSFCYVSGRKAMNNSYKYFENRECKYFPCHKGLQDINCLFCYCPLYNQENCPGKYKYIESNGRLIKESADCTFPHEAENYDIIMALLSVK